MMKNKYNKFIKIYLQLKNIWQSKGWQNGSKGWVKNEMASSTITLHHEVGVHQRKKEGRQCDIT